jgi:hypothetical protein
MLLSTVAGSPLVRWVASWVASPAVNVIGGGDVDVGTLPGVAVAVWEIPLVIRKPITAVKTTVTAAPPISVRRLDVPVMIPRINRPVADLSARRKARGKSILMGMLIAGKA